MDVVCGGDSELGMTFASTLDDICVTNDELAAQHAPLSVSTMLCLGATTVRFCSSDFIPEREQIRERAILAFRDRGVDPSQETGLFQVGLFQIEISEPVIEVRPAEDEMRRMYMHDALRWVINAWAQHTDRIVLSGMHSLQFAGVSDENGEEVVLDDHIHVIYEREESDPPNFMQAGIGQLVSQFCRWEAIEDALGIDADGPRTAETMPGMSSRWANSEASARLRTAKASMPAEAQDDLEDEPVDAGVSVEEEDWASQEEGFDEDDMLGEGPEDDDPFDEPVFDDFGGFDDDE